MCRWLLQAPIDPSLARFATLKLPWEYSPVISVGCTAHTKKHIPTVLPKMIPKLRPNCKLYAQLQNDPNLLQGVIRERNSHPSHLAPPPSPKGRQFSIIEAVSVIYSFKQIFCVGDGFDQQR